MTEPIEVETAKRKGSMLYRVYFCEQPGGEMKHRFTCANLDDAEARARELGDKGCGTQIVEYDSDFPSTAPPSRLPRVEESAIPEVCGSDKAPEGWSCTRVYGHDGPCAAMQIPIQVDSNDPPVCQRCESEYNLRDGYEVSKYCDTCAQELVTEYEFRLVAPAPIPSATAPYTYQSLYEAKAKQLAGLIVSNHAPSIDKVARLLAKEDAGR